MNGKSSIENNFKVQGKEYSILIQSYTKKKNYLSV